MGAGQSPETSTRFNSFLLWHPDIPVDEGRDEYLRSPSELVNVVVEVRHRKRVRVDQSYPDNVL